MEGCRLEDDRAPGDTLDPGFQLLMNFSVIPGTRFPLGVLIFIISAE